MAKQITDAERVGLILNELHKLEGQIINLGRTFYDLGVVAEGNSIREEDEVKSARHNGRSVAYSTCALTVEALVGACRQARNEAYRNEN
jgi:hypothetical protein